MKGIYTTRTISVYTVDLEDRERTDIVAALNNLEKTGVVLPFALMQFRAFLLSGQWENGTVSGENIRQTR
jgi:hypothetical protein